MDSYARDLRERVIQAWQDGKRQGWIAETLAVSVSTVKEWIKRYQETERLEPLPRGREQPLIKDEQASAVPAMVDRLAEATLAQYCEAWAPATGQPVSQPTMCRALQRFDRPRKKRPAPPASAMKQFARSGVR
jgi:transposase